MSWVPNVPFEAKLHIVSMYSSGNSATPEAITVDLKDMRKGLYYCIRYNDFMDLINKGEIKKFGEITQTWRFEKRGPYLVLTHR